MQHLLWCFPVPEVQTRPLTTGAGAGRGHLMDKQSLVPVVQELWSAWEIHVLILLSLSLQVFLFLFAGMRRSWSNWFLRTILWLAYLSADSVAVFVLGHLAVRGREPGHQLVAFWAPFLLVHLGGQDTITAFSKQDNELWGRHLLNLVLQAGVAGYVVAKASWPDIRLRAAMVIMFVCGCLKYAARINCLFFADPKILRLYSEIVLVEKLKWEQGKWELKKSEGTRYEAKQDMRARLDRMEKGRAAERPRALLDEAQAIIKEVISVDAPLNKVQNITVAAHGDLPELLEGFLSNKSRYRTYEHLAELLQYCHRLLYTKYPMLSVLTFLTPPFDYNVNPILKIFCSIFSVACLLSTAIAASISLALLAAIKKGDQLDASSRVDITVTYALLVGAILLDVSSAAIFFFPHFSFYHPCLAKATQSSVLACCLKQWSQQIGQYNVINNAPMPRILQLFHFDVERKPITKDDTSIEKFILDTLLRSGTRKEWSMASTRGQLALHNWMLDHHQYEAGHDSADHLKSLEETLEADFPTSVLILHIATDICYHYGGCTNSDHQAVSKHKQTSTQLSHYIMYLVFKCGVMLSTNSKVVHYRTCAEIIRVSSHSTKVHDPRNKDDARVMKLFEAIKEQQEEGSMREIQIRLGESEEDSTVEIENEEPTDIHDNAADEHIKKLKRSSQTLTSCVLPCAVAVAQELISIKNEAKRWELIAMVWAEMLYYTAPRCGGDFHYEHLSTGGEFVTHVLLLMYYLGPFLPPPPDA